jgi:hypothetical protein
MPVNTRLQVRRGSAALWTSQNPILYSGEIGFETDTKKIKIGDGTTAWNDLNYTSVPLNSTNFVESSGINIVFDSVVGGSGSWENATWSVDETWLANFIATSSGSLNVEGVQDIIGNSGVVGGFGIDKSYNDSTGFTTVSVTGMTLRVEESTGIGVTETTESSNKVYSIAVTGIDHTLINDWDAAISGNIDTQLIAGTGINFVYDSGNNTLTISTAVLDDTHTHIWDNITDAKVKASLTELGYLSGVVPGTASANRVVVLDSSKDIDGIRNLTATDTVTAVTFSGDLSGDVTSTGSSSFASVDINGGSIDGTVIGANSAAVVSGTSVYASVGFVGDLTGDVTGNADTATEATNVTVTANNGTNETVYLTFVDDSTGTQGIETDTDLSYNPSTNTLTVGTVVGNISSADQVKTVTTDTGTHYLTFVDSDNGSATNETVRTDGDLSYNAATNLLTSPNVTATGTVTAGHIDVTTLTSTGNVTVGGDLTVAGTTTTVNSTVVEIGDNIIRVNTSGLPTGGLEVRNSGTSDYKQLVWDKVDTRWEVGSENFQANRFISTVADGTAPFVVTSTTLVDNLNADLLDGQEGSYYLDWGNFANTPTPDVSVALTGDVSGSATVSSWNLSDNLSISINAIIQPDSVALGTDTTGNYVAAVAVDGSGLTLGGSAGEGATFTVESNATPANTADTIVSRDASGDFSAGTITATFSGNGSSLTDLNASNISSGTLDSARLPSVSRTNGTAGPTNSFVSSVTTDQYGRVTAVNTTTHTLATTSVKGIASFDSGDFSVTTGAVSIKASGVGNLQLENDSVTFGTTEVELGSSSNRIDGLVAISGVSAAAPTVLTFCTIDGGTP